MHSAEVDEYTNGHANGHVNGYANGYANGQADKNMNGHANGHANSHNHTNGHAKQPQPTTKPQQHSTTLRLALRSELPTLATVLAAAFLDFELYDHFLPRRHAQSAQYYRYLLHRLRQLWADPNCRFVVAETVTSRPIPSEFDNDVADSAVSGPTLHVTSSQQSIVGFAIWETMGRRNLLGDLWRSQGYDASASGRSWLGFSSAISAAVEPCLLEAEFLYQKHFRNRLLDHRALRYIGALMHHNFDALDACLHLQFLVTHPEHQGTGAGGKLLEWGLSLAREWGLCAVLESSLKGWRFYERRGFKVVGMIRVGKVEKGAESNSPFRDDAEPFDMPVLIWEPEGKGGMWSVQDGKGGWRLRDGVGRVSIEEGEQVVEA